MTVRIPPAHPDEPSEVFTIDFRETAPEKSNTTMYPPHSNSSQYGGLSVGVPGEIRGLEEAHRRFCRVGHTAVHSLFINHADGEAYRGRRS